MKPTQANNSKPYRIVFINLNDERPIPSTTPSMYAPSEAGDLAEPSVLFPSMRLMLAAMLCCCFITLSISSSNLAEGLVLAAQNAGSLLTLVTGMWADRLNGKWMVFVALLLCCIGNLVLPLFAAQSFWFAVAARIAVGASDACLMPACNSLITRWFPQSERAAAIGLISGGRQIGGSSASRGFCLRVRFLTSLLRVIRPWRQRRPWWRPDQPAESPELGRRSPPPANTKRSSQTPKQ
ncbi:hypothetical protein OESDEN_06855 [Oesophagostomum dentatum]|uniref:Major facilitator superfamily (MFS) profile domain-containing protein n=1 Tax=Oesophagostomum dentatum TaxID=61180 RepID=A0A0B1T6R2_OESDE|nr:hypothetical protein OESDEN_06855 [Oesophagostomum dentatum]